MTKDVRNSYDFFDIMQTMLTKPFYIIYNPPQGGNLEIIVWMLFALLTV